MIFVVFVVIAVIWDRGKITYLTLLKMNYKQSADIKNVKILFEKMRSFLICLVTIKMSF